MKTLRIILGKNELDKAKNTIFELLTIPYYKEKVVDFYFNESINCFVFLSEYDRIIQNLQIALCEDVKSDEDFSGWHRDTNTSRKYWRDIPLSFPDVVENYYNPGKAMEKIASNVNFSQEYEILEKFYRDNVV